ncbi:unnamed protein product [Paramecium octaurelia]|uniref:Uncharacterized protein n=1 Tax=Paramecium octaurelia TaxID=43137 RepID=A0A8S1YA85_PAROT|nr:unnamed protein product [Paramecium octaurelia]
MAEVATELTSNVMNKAFPLFIQDQVLAITKAKYLAAQAQAAEKTVPQKDDKKDTKKGTNEIAAAAPNVEPEKLAPEKEYPKNFDLVFIVQGFPQVPQEQIELIIHVKEGVINWSGVEITEIEQPEEFQDDFEGKMGFVPQLHDQQLVFDREHQIFDNLCYPGIPEKSEKMRKAIKGQVAYICQCLCQ